MSRLWHPLNPKRTRKSCASDQASTFRLFITPTVENIILEMTNREDRRKYCDEWRGMDETDLRAYVGLLILVGVYRSPGRGCRQPVGHRERPGDISCHDAPKTLPNVLQTAALRRPRDETQETNHGQIGGRARSLGRMGGEAPVPLQPGARGDSGRATGSVQRLVFFF